MNVGDKITIRYSKKLERHGNAGIANKTGVITRVFAPGGRVMGAYVDVCVARKVKNYYVPASSIEGPDEIGKVCVLSILKSAVI